MIREIITDKGNFGTFKDILRFMELEHMSSIEIKAIQLWNFSYLENLVGIYSIDEIRKTVKG